MEQVEKVIHRSASWGVRLMGVSHYTERLKQVVSQVLAQTNVSNRPRTGGQYYRGIASELGMTPTRIAVDLTPILPEGENGGAKIVAVELVRDLAKAAPEWEFVLLTSPNTHDELSGLDAANVWRLCVAHQGGGSHLQVSVLLRIKRLLEGMLAAILPPSLFERVKAIYRSALRLAPSQPKRNALLQKIGANLLFCPFTAPLFFNPPVPLVAVVIDLQHRYYPNFFRKDERLYRDDYLRSACQVADRLICISDYVRMSLMESAEVRPEKAITIRPLFFNRFARPSSENVVRVLDHSKLKADRFLFYPANFWPHKNHRMLLTAYGIYRAHHPESDLKLVCTGAVDAQMGHVRNAAECMGLGGWVVFPGFVPDEEFAALLQSCRAVIFPSLYEGFGMPILEAMAIGKPVLCSNVTSLPEIAGDAALFFDPRKPLDIVSVIERIETDPGLVKDLTQRGNQHLTTFGDSAEMVQQYLRVFRQVMWPSDFAGTVYGVHADGWTSERIVIKYGPSHQERYLEIALNLPLYCPSDVSATITQSRWFRPEPYKIERGQVVTLRHALPHREGFVEVLINPVFQPKALAINKDLRMLGCICQACLVVSPNETLDLLERMS